MRRAKRGGKSAPDKPFTPKELTSSLGELSCSMVHDPRDGPLSRPPMRIPAITPKVAGITLMAGAMLYTLAGMAPWAAGVLGQPDFPHTGEFRIRPDHAAAPLGKIRLTASDSNLVIQLHGQDGSPVYLGFVRARERATLQVPAGNWKSLIVPTAAWDGAPALVSSKQFSSMGTIKVVKGKQINITADDMGRIADRGR